jgi:hypothetical protein
LNGTWNPTASVATLWTTSYSKASGTPSLASGQAPILTFRPSADHGRKSASGALRIMTT